MKKIILWTVIGGVIIAGGITIHIVRKHQQEARVAQAVAAKKAMAAMTSNGQPKRPSFMSNPLWVIPSTGDMEGLKEMLDKQPDQLNALVGGMHATMLHVAAYKGQAAMVAELLRRGAKVNLRTKQGHTPLYDCIDNLGTVEIAAMLLDAGADVTIADNAGKTPLQLAIDKNRDDIADLLRQHGAQK
jgi:hypothetical protein